MEMKHFSHDHALTLYHMAEGSETLCSGCKLPGLTTVYMCWQCQYFLHEQCFEAKRSIIHPSHPSHPLTLLPCSTYTSSSFLCNSCHLSGTGFSYACSHCDFDIHLHCAYTSSQSQPYSNYQPTSQTSQFTYPEVSEAYPPPPFQVQPYHAHVHAENAPVMDAYPSFPQPPYVPPYAFNGHVMPNYAAPANPNLTISSPIENQPDSNTTHVAKHFSHQHALLQSNIEEEDGVLCSGCEHAITESPAYTCTKSKFCNFRLHKSCFDLPKQIHHRSHMAHPLTLLSAPPYKSYNPEFTCNACLKTGNSFLYHCSSCSFDLHVNCAFLKDSVKRDDHEHPLSLLFSSPYEKSKDGEDEVIFMCDVCQESVDSNCWVYYCRECDFGTDVGCINDEIEERGEEQREESVEDDGLTPAERLVKMQNEFQLMQFRMQMNQRMNQSIISMGQSLANLA
ncbi:uncharacterized protein LOC124924923 [Impatiens glandulifera]|uniref:uncharacterized protein LOC124924923 n=1 Tax=Impatiens glandulifera TaxID=253017 RepID=UPI001FB05817|nr:uncharacterized protein LOC124924923 [Impatiens glandulifera]